MEKLIKPKITFYVCKKLRRTSALFNQDQS